MIKVTSKKLTSAGERISAIRSRGLRASRGCLVKETTRQSLSREFFVRTRAIPFFKENLGESFLAMTLHGSAQLGVRKATERESRVYGKHKSDVDISVAVPKGYFKSLEARKAYEDDCSKRLSQIGYPTHVHVFNTAEFVNNLNFGLTNGEPFQILFGRNIIANSDKYVPNLKLDLKKLPKIRKSYTKGKYFAR